MKLPKIKITKKPLVPTLLLLGAVITISTGVFLSLQNPEVKKRVTLAIAGDSEYTNQITSLSQELAQIKNQDQVKRNDQLQLEIKNIETTYKGSVEYYQQIADLKAQSVKTDDLDKTLAQALKYLADQNYASASSTLVDLERQLKEAHAKLAQISTPTTTTQNAPLAVNNSTPGSGYSRQSVQTDVGSFTVDIIAADLNSTKVIVDTASDNDCSNNCPVMSVADYASRNGAWAAINGNFFCPPEYPDCAGKTNSFDTLVMNKKKHYFNSDNNVYSVVPAAIFGPGWARFVSRTLEWGRDTSPDAVIANYPLLIAGNNIVYNSSDNAKFNAKGSRMFIASKANMVYIGGIYNATMAEAAHVLKTLGMDNALNLDEGGSTALWYGGHYLVGPGRNLPNSVLFVKR